MVSCQMMPCGKGWFLILKRYNSLGQRIYKTHIQFQPIQHYSVETLNL